MKISYNEATARDCSSLEKDLELCEKHGFDFIEIRLDMLREYLKAHTLGELKEFFAHSHLKPHAFNAIYIFNEMFREDNSDPAREDKVMDDFMLACKTGREIGSHYMIVVADIYDDAANEIVYTDTKENIFNDSVRILRRLSGIAQAYHMNLCFEPVGSIGCAVRTVGQAKEIVEEVDRENVGYVFDPINLFLYDHKNDFSAICGVEARKIFAVHINNADDKPIGVLDQCDRRFCDSGIIDLQNYLRSIKATGYDGMVSIETFRPEYWDKDPEWVIAEAYKTTRMIMEQAGAF